MDGLMMIGRKWIYGHVQVKDVLEMGDLGFTQIHFHARAPGAPDLHIVDVSEHAPVIRWLVTSAALRTDSRI